MTVDCRPTRRGLSRALNALLRAELATARGRRGSEQPVGVTPAGTTPADMASAGMAPAGDWLDEARITGSGPGDLGCDSLEALWLSSAACEMFELAEVDCHHTLTASDRFGEWLDIIMGSWADGPRGITFSTSGTTGRPKRHSHALAVLDDEARHFAGLFADTRRVLAFVPAHHIYGFLFTAMLPDMLGAEVLDGAAATRAVAAPLAGDLIIAFPERWAWIERVVRRWPPGVRGVTSTAPCPRELVEAIAEAGLVDFTEVYGSSETGGIATRTWPSPAYRLLPRWVFAEGDDALVDQAGNRFALPDGIERRGSEGFVPIGRRDGMVQVGGINVDPERVCAALRERPGVAEVAVRLMRPEEGARLKAFVVAAPNTCESDLHDALDAWTRAQLETPSRPCSWSFGPSLPRNPYGKLADW